MNPIRFLWIAGVIAAHPNRKVFGRMRLQKEVKLLQSLGLPTDYGYTMHFYGPYSVGLQAEIGVLQSMKLVKEEQQFSQSGATYYVLTAEPQAILKEIEPFQSAIDRMEKAEPVTLELAATYQAFREMGSDHNEALLRLKQKKGSKCDGGNQEKALALLADLKLTTN